MKLMQTSSSSYIILRMFHKCFLLFNNDYTKICWVYFIRLKSDSFYVIKLFKSLVENHCNLSINALRSDGGGEFMSSQFVEFYNNPCIQCQLTLTYTPQQNSMSERKNKTIMEMTGCLFARKKDPKLVLGEGSQYLCIC